MTEAAHPLDALALEAAGLEAPAGEGAAGGQAGAPPPPVQSLDERNTQALCFLAAMLRTLTETRFILDPPLVTLSRHLADDKLPGLLEPWARVATFYGRDLLAIVPAMDHPALQAAITTGPALYLLVVELRAELAERRKSIKARPPAAVVVEPASADPGRPE